MKIKKGDTVIITSGKDRGRKGKILQSFPSEKRVVVENLNLKKKSVKARNTGEKGQVVEFPAPIDVSNTMLVCTRCAKPTRVGYLIKKDGKVRICKKCQGEI